MEIWRRRRDRDRVRAAALAFVTVIGIAGCSEQPTGPIGGTPSEPAQTEPAQTEPAQTEPSPSATSFDPDSCPVADEAACMLAAEVATALVASDAARITALSRAAEFVCDQETGLPLPACEPGLTLTGHPLIDSRPVIEVLDDAAYAGQNESILNNIDSTYTDEHGTGAMQVLGVGTCGPDIPERRSYHVAYTAAVDAKTGTERFVGSYELNLLEGEWLIGTAFLDTYDAWLSAYQDPLRELGCNPVRWR